MRADKIKTSINKQEQPISVILELIKQSNHSTQDTPALLKFIRSSIDQHYPSLTETAKKELLKYVEPYVIEKPAALIKSNPIVEMLLMNGSGFKFELELSTPENIVFEPDELALLEPIKRLIDRYCPSLMKEAKKNLLYTIKQYLKTMHLYSMMLSMNCLDKAFSNLENALNNASKGFRNTQDFSEKSEEFYRVDEYFRFDADVKFGVLATNAMIAAKRSLSNEQFLAAREILFKTSFTKFYLSILPKALECEIVSVSSPSTEETLRNLPIESVSAYVRSGDKLFYINKSNEAYIEEIGIDESTLEKFDNLGLLEYSNRELLSDFWLNLITGITGHTPASPELPKETWKFLEAFFDKVYVRLNSQEASSKSAKEILEETEIKEILDKIIQITPVKEKELMKKITSFLDDAIKVLSEVAQVKTTLHKKWSEQEILDIRKNSSFLVCFVLATISLADKKAEELAVCSADILGKEISGKALAGGLEEEDELLLRMLKTCELFIFQSFLRFPDVKIDAHVPGTISVSVFPTDVPDTFLSEFFVEGDSKPSYYQIFPKSSELSPSFIQDLNRLTTLTLEEFKLIKQLRVESDKTNIQISPKDQLSFFIKCISFKVIETASELVLMNEGKFFHDEIISLLLDLMMDPIEARLLFFVKCIDSGVIGIASILVNRRGFPRDEIIPLLHALMTDPTGAKLSFFLECIDSGVMTTALELINGYKFPCDEIISLWVNPANVDFDKINELRNDANDELITELLSGLKTCLETFKSSGNTSATQKAGLFACTAKSPGSTSPDVGHTVDSATVKQSTSP